MPDIDIIPENAEVGQALADTKKNLIKDLYFGTAEKTFYTSPEHADSMLDPYNRDDIYQKTSDYSIYEDMKNDDQVNPALQLKIDLILGSGWNIVAEDESLQEMAEMLYIMLEDDPNGCLDDDLENLLDDGQSFGFALSEKRFQMRNDNFLTFHSLRTRHPSTWRIYVDEKGNVDKYEQSGPRGTIDVNPRSLIHFINQPKHSNPYGTSDLRKAYAPWFVKRHIIRYYSKYLEKASSPMPVAKYDSSVPAAKVQEVHNIIKRFQNSTAFTIPKEFEVAFLEAQNSGEPFIKGLNLFNLYIGRALLVPDLIGISGSETGGGSYDLGDRQMELFFKHLRRRRRQLERIVNHHIIKPLVVWNWGFVDNFPKFVLNPISEQNAVEYANTFINAMNGKLYKPQEQEINYFRSLIGFPEGDVEFHQEQPQYPAGGAGGFNPFLERGGEERGIDQQPMGDPTVMIPGSNDPEKVDEHFNKNKENYALGGPYDEPKGDYHKKVNFEDLKNQLETFNSIVNAESLPIVKQIFTDLFDQIQKKKILGNNPKIDRIETLKLKNLKGMSNLIKKNSMDHFQKNQTLARKDLFGDRIKFTTPLNSEIFLKLLDEETFNFIGEWEFAILRSAKQELRNAIKDGRPLSSVKDFLDTQGLQDAMVSIDRYSRTKGTEIMNRARVKEFEDSGVVSGYQYSAILDGRTTPICRGLHGKKFKAGTEPIPPMHFNCRSMLIPITVFEDFDPDQKVGQSDINKFIEENKGQGFSKN